MTFVAIDFETATGYRNSACAIGIVTINNGKIVDEYHTLIQPPDNAYWSQNIRVHGITSRDTYSAPTFNEIFPEIEKRIKNRVVVAHNESFDRSVLKNTMSYYGLDYYGLNLADRWECTMKIYKAKGFTPYNLGACCREMNIPLKHHDALSDARGCAILYYRRNE
jgi:DNA polymerase-3 subunit epsilon